MVYIEVNHPSYPVNLQCQISSFRETNQELTDYVELWEEDGNPLASKVAASRTRLNYR